MKVWAASVSDESGHGYVFVDTCKDGIWEQVRDLAIDSYGQTKREDYERWHADDYLGYEEYLVGEHFRFGAEGEFDL